MLSRCFLDFSVGIGAFVVGLSQISIFYLEVPYKAVEGACAIYLMFSHF